MSDTRETATARMYVPNRLTGRSRILFAIPGQAYDPVKFTDAGGDLEDPECIQALSGPSVATPGEPGGEAGAAEPSEPGDADPVGVIEGKVVGNVDQVNAWIGDDLDRAGEVLAAGETRKGVLDHIEALTAGDGED